MKRKLALLLVAMLIIGLLAGCGKKEVAASEDNAVGIYTDGVYEGVGEGFKGDIKLSVKVENGNITGIDIVEMNESAGIGDVAIEQVIEKIIEAQSTEVDVVSGATVSSKGTIEAVEVALGLRETKPQEEEVVEAEEPEVEEAAAEQKPAEQKSAEQKSAEQKSAEQKSAEQKSAEQKSAEQKSAEQKSAEQKSAEQKPAEQKPTEEKPAVSGYKDGSYTGKDKGFYGDIEVRVNIKDGKITKIDILSMDETEGIGDTAVKEVIKRAVSKQSGDVDGVSGATISSQGTIKAIKKALDQAK